MAKGPVGAHAISGSWRITKASTSDNALLMMLKVEGDTVIYSDPTGVSFTAKLGGSSVPMKGDPSHTEVSLRLVGKNAMVSTYRVNGKMSGTERMTVAANGKTMTDVSTDAKTGTTSRGVFEKQ